MGRSLSALWLWAALWLLLPPAIAPAQCPVAVAGGERMERGEFEALFGSGAQPDTLTVRLAEEYLLALGEARRARLDTLCGVATDDSLYRQAMVTAARLIFVEEPALTDSALSAYFDAHIADFGWSIPRYKGLLLLATDDSVAVKAAAEARAMYGFTKNVEQLRAAMRRSFGTRVRLLNVRVEQGRNPFVDYAVFGGERPAPDGDWHTAIAIGGRIIDRPEEAADVMDELRRVALADAYARWIAALRSRR